MGGRGRQGGQGRDGKGRGGMEMGGIGPPTFWLLPPTTPILENKRPEIKKLGLQERKKYS